MPETTEEPQFKEPEFKSPEALKREAGLSKMLNRYASLPGEYLRDNTVSHGAKMVWLFLYLISNKYGESFWKLRRIAKTLGISLERIKDHLKELVKTGWLKKRKMENSQSKIYTLVFPDSCPNPRKAGEDKNDRMRNMQQTIIEKNDSQFRPRNNGGGFGGALPEKDFDQSDDFDESNEQML